MVIQYLGMLAEAVGQNSEEVNQQSMLLHELKEHLIKLHPELQSMRFKVAINHAVNTNEAIEVTSNDEIALLPPFAGG